MKLRRYIVFAVFLLMLAAAPVWGNAAGEIATRVETGALGPGNTTGLESGE